MLTRPFALLVSAAFFIGCAKGPKIDLSQHATEAKAAAKTHADWAYTAYTECWLRADQFKNAVTGFVQQPSGPTLGILRETWADAHALFSQTEVLRFTGGPIDAAYSGIDAWPITPELIDYATGKPSVGLVNDSTQATLDVELLVRLRAGSAGTPGQVFSGFHVIEYLLWGEDLYPDGPGSRVFTDFSKARNADRRRALLEALASKLALDMRALSEAWDPSQPKNYRSGFLAEPPLRALFKAFDGVRHLCASALDRKLSASAPESSDFSDTSLADITNNVIGMQQLWLGSFTGTGSNRMDATGASMKALVTIADAELANTIDAALTKLLGAAKGSSSRDQLATQVAALGKLWERAIVSLGLQASSKTA